MHNKTEKPKPMDLLIIGDFKKVPQELKRKAIVRYNLIETLILDYQEPFELEEMRYSLNRAMQELTKNMEDPDFPLGPREWYLLMRLQQFLVELEY